MTIKIEEMLRTELSAEVEGTTVPEHVFDNALRRHGRRRTVTRVVGAATGVAGVTAVAVCALAVAGPTALHGGQHGTTSAAPAPGLETVADIRPKIIDALDSTHAIIYTTYHETGESSGLSRSYGPGRAQQSDNWFDTDTGYVTNYDYYVGKLRYASHYPLSASGTDTEVNYKARTYYSFQEPKRPAPTATTTKGGYPLLDSIEGIKAAVQRPGVRIVGHQQINGRDATHLQYSIHENGYTVTGDSWFDSETYAPLKSATATTATGGTVTDLTSFLPRTEANIAKAEFKVPAGFRKVPRPSNK